jgi:hypothetical protein
MRKVLTTRFGFKPADTTILTDSGATREGIITKIKMYEKIAGEGDLFFFHYSGHGTLFPDKYSEEHDETQMQYVELPNDRGEMEVVIPRDKYDSAIVPYNAGERTSGKTWNNLILDDELYAMFTAFTKKGAQVVFVSDSCHSGSVARAKANTVPTRFMPLHRVFNASSFSQLNLSAPAVTRAVTAPPQMSNLYITLTGSKDNEFSLDGGGPSGEKMGLFTSTLLKNLNGPAALKMTYAQLMSKVSAQVSKAAILLENNQNPQLDSRFGNSNMIIFSTPKAKPGPVKKGR